MGERRCGDGGRLLMIVNAYSNLARLECWICGIWRLLLVDDKDWMIQ